MTGYLISIESHIHISIFDENCNVYEVHLLPGTIVYKSLNILLGGIPNFKTQKIFNLNEHPTIVEIYGLPDCPWSKRDL